MGSQRLPLQFARIFEQLDYALQQAPGAAAIEATAHPLNTDALYFVASGRGDGSHVFSATLDEHNAAVAQYLARQRQRAASEPAR